jgi:hypothetical protein
VENARWLLEKRHFFPTTPGSCNHGRVTAVIPINLHASMPRTVINTAGEPEREARSPRANAIEALLVMGFILATLWPFCFAWGVLGENASVRGAAEWAIKVVFVWVLGISWWWHRDSAESLGLGNPRRLYRMLCDSQPARRWRWLAAMGVVFAGLVFVTLTQWPLTRKFLRLPEAATAWTWPPIFALGCVLGLLVVTCLVRYDNFAAAFRAALTISGVLIVYAAAGAMLQRGWAAFARFELGRYALDLSAYFFWGYFQQLIFTGYLGTRLRKGFPPSTSPYNVVPPERRAPIVLLGALLAAGVLAPAVWFLVRGVSGADAAPLAMLVWFAAFAFPAGAVWAWFYCLDRRRLLVASLAGAFFGLIHLQSYGLVLVTGGLGVMLAWLFMEDRTRNLSALAFIHGFLGSTFGKMFNGADAGALRVNYRVGPWNVNDPAAHALIVPMFCLAAILVLGVWCWRRLPVTCPA